MGSQIGCLGHGDCIQMPKSQTSLMLPVQRILPGSLHCALCSTLTGVAVATVRRVVKRTAVSCIVVVGIGIDLYGDDN